MSATKAITLFSLVTVALMGAPTPAHAEDGNRLLHSCKILDRILNGKPIPKDRKPLQMGLDAGYCNGLLIGAVSTMISYRSHLDEGLIEDKSSAARSLFGCFPDVVEINSRELVRIIVKYLENRAEDLHEPGPVLAEEGLIEAFPCK